MEARRVRRRTERGVALVLAVVILSVLVGLGVVLADYVVQGYRQTHADYDDVRAHACADAGVDLALDILTRADTNPFNDAFPSAPTLLEDGWNFRGSITRSFASSTYTLESRGLTLVRSASDVLSGDEGGFQVVIRNPTGVAAADGREVEVVSYGWVGPSPSRARSVYRAVVRVRKLLQPVTDAIRARGTVKINAGGTRAVRLRDGASPIPVPDGQPGDTEAHVRSAGGIITGNCIIDGVATVYGDNYISGTVDAVAYQTGDPAPPDLLPSNTDMEASRRRWLDAADANDGTRGWGPDLRTLAGYNTPTGRTNEFIATGYGGGTYELTDSGALTIKSGVVEIQAPAHFTSISMDGGTLRLRAAASPAENVVYVGSASVTVPQINTTQVVTIKSGCTLETEVTLVVNGRMSSAGVYRATTTAASSTQALGRVGLVVLGDDQSGGQPALTLQSANSDTEVAGMIFSMGSTTVNGNGYVVGAIMAAGAVTFNGSNAYVNFPVNLFAAPGFEKAKVMAYHAERSAYRDERGT